MCTAQCCDCAKNNPQTAGKCGMIACMSDNCDHLRCLPPSAINASVPLQTSHVLERAWAHLSHKGLVPPLDTLKHLWRPRGPLQAVCVAVLLHDDLASVHCIQSAHNRGRAACQPCAQHTHTLSLCEDCVAEGAERLEGTTRLLFQRL
jgi:hypothetical protein